MGSTCKAGWRPAVVGVLVFAFLYGASVLAADPVHDVQVRSGGIGSEERAELFAERSNYNLRLAFADTGGAYIAGVEVKLYQQRGGSYHEVYAGSGEGPWFFARVEPGRYRVEATHRGVTQTREMQVGPQQKAAQIFVRWRAADGKG